LPEHLLIVYPIGEVLNSLSGGMIPVYGAETKTKTRISQHVDAAGMRQATPMPIKMDVTTKDSLVVLTMPDREYHSKSKWTLLTKDNSDSNCAHKYLNLMVVFHINSKSSMETHQSGTAMQCALVWQVQLSVENFNYQLMSDVPDVLSDGHTELLTHQLLILAGIQTQPKHSETALISALTNS